MNRYTQGIVIHRPDASGSGVCLGCVEDLEARLFHFLASKGLDTPDLVSSQIPLVDWVVSDQMPGTIALTLLCYERPASGLHTFFHGLVSRYLRPGHRVPILSSRCLTFSFEASPETIFYFGEMLVGVGKENERKEMILEVPQITQDLKRGATLPEKSDRVLEERGLSPDQKLDYSAKRVLRFFKRYQIPYVDDVRLHQSWWQMSACEGSLRGRSLAHLSWLLASLVLLNQHVRKEAYISPEQRGVKVALRRVQLRYPFGAKSALGVVIAIRAEAGAERLEEAHLLSAVSEIIPGSKTVDGSFCAYQMPGDPIRMLYCEIDGPYQTHHVARLKKELSGELKDRVQMLIPSLFTPRNEEETLRSLLVLAKELRYVGDPPQVVISYEEMTKEGLVFSIICVRLMKEGALSTPALLQRLPATWKCWLEHEEKVGMVRKRHPKLGSVFTVTLDKQAFLRKDYAVDLHRARSHIAEELAAACGVLRDYNGGLIVKQNEVLSAAKALLGQAAKKQEHLLERLFYSLSPAVMQSYLSPNLLAALFSLFQEGLAAPLGAQGYEFKVSDEPAGMLLMIRSARPNFKEEVIASVGGVCPDPLSWASSFVEAGPFCCLALLFLGRDRNVAREMEKAAEKAMQAYVRRNRNQQIVRFHVARATKSLDPRIGVDRRSGVVIKMLYEGLMRLGEEGKPHLAIARQVDTSDDQRSYTFWLRESYWSDGKRVTAHDFEYAWKKAVDPHFVSRHAYLFFPIKNARKVRSGELPIDALGVCAEGDHKLVVELENPVPYFLDYVTHWSYSPVPKNIDERAPEWAHERGSAYVSNGPFKLEKRMAGEDLFLVKNPHYWDVNSVSLSEIHLLQIRDGETALALFDQGKLDWLGEPLCELPRDAEQRIGVKAIPAVGVCCLNLNVAALPFNSKKMRQAFAYAIDRKKLVHEILPGRGGPAFSLIPKGMEPGALLPFPDGDIALARKLFEEGLAELQMTREELGPILLAYPMLHEQAEMVRFVAKSWEQAFGIRVACDGWAWHSYLGSHYDQVVQVSTQSWYSWVDDPVYSLEPYQFGDNTFNGPHWENVQYARLLNEAEGLVDRVARLKKLAEAESILMNEMPAIPLYHIAHRYLTSPKFHRVQVAKIGQIDFKTSYIGEPEFAGESASISPLRLNIRAEPISFDPRIGADSRSASVIRMLFEGLMHIGPDEKPRPGIASDVEISSDKTLYTFTLRPSNWTDGHPLTAYDFEFAWKQALDPDFDTAYDYFFYFFYNGEAAKKGRVSTDEVGVRALGPDKLCVRLQHPIPYFLELISYPVYAPVPRHLATNRDGWHQASAGLVSNGPFQLAMWERGRRMHLVKNPQYWNASSVALEGIQLAIGASARMNLYGFETGDFDWAGQPLSDLPTDQLQVLQKKNILHMQPVAGIFRLDFNCEKAPFTSKKMRTAFAWAIDKTALIEEVLNGSGKLASSLLPPHLSFTNELEAERRDRNRARLLFEESLVEQGLNKATTSPITFSYPLNEQYRVMAQFLQRQWQEVFDIPILLEGCEWKEYLGKLLKGKYQLGNSLWYSWVNDPFYNLMAFRRKAQFFNTCQWEHPEYLTQLNRAENATEKEARLAYLKAADQLLREEVPSEPLYMAEYRYVQNKALRDVFISLLGWIDFRWAKLKKEISE